MSRRKKYPRLPNGYGSIKRLSGRNRTNPFGVYPPVTKYTDDGVPVCPKALCYVDDWYKGFTVLTWYRNGEYYPGREKELSSDRRKLDEQINTILSKYSQGKRELIGRKTFDEVFKEYYIWKFKDAYGHAGRKTQMEYSIRAGYKNCSILHDRPFTSLKIDDLQKVLDDCPLKHSSVELIKFLFNQMYDYAIANDIIDKNYAAYTSIQQEEDDESGVPFTSDELDILWQHKNDEIIEMILIMCYSGFRITSYKFMEVNLEKCYFRGGLKTEAGKERTVPIHSGIYGMVRHRINRDGSMLAMSVSKFRKSMYQALKDIGIEKHTPHDCRHTFSALCEKYEVNENDRKRMLGHSFGGDITNAIYGHRELEDLRAEIEKIKCVTNVSLTV